MSRRREARVTVSARACKALRVARLAAGLLALCLAVGAWLLWREVSRAAPAAELRAPAPTVLLVDRRGRFLDELPTGEGGDGELGYWALESLPPRVVAATLAIEDRRFWWHPGVDPLAAARALWQNWRTGRRVSGASTLAMQVARMQDPGGRTPERKAREALAALALVLRHGREAVLAHYLRLVPYGNRIHGIAYAARRYFDKPVEDLSWAEIAFLSAIPQAPGRMNPFLPDGRVAAVRRGQRILSALRGRRTLSEAEYGVAASELDHLEVQPLARRPAEALHAVLRLGEIVREPSSRALLPPGRPVVAALDLDVQAEVVSLLGEALASWQDRGAGNAAAVVLDRRSGEVLAWVGSAGYFDNAHSGAIDYARVPRSAGSTLKPLLYALALDRGALTPATVMDDLRRAPGAIENADDAFLGPLLPREALANSRNVPAAELVERVGLDEAYSFLGRLGLHDFERPARDFGLGLAVGSLPVSLEHLVRAYGCLARDGELGELRWWRAASPGSGPPAAAPRRVLSAAAARQVTLFLSDPLARLPSFPRMGATEYSFPVAVKTGTSSGYRDAWTLAYSTRYLVGVWVGNPDWSPMKNLSGFTSAAALCQRLLASLHRRPEEGAGLADLSFPPPEGHRPVGVCAVTGARATDACPRVFTEWFRPGREPQEPCRVHVRVAVDARDGSRATPATPAARVELRTFADLPPRYAAWASAQGLARPPAAFAAARVPAGEGPDDAPALEAGWEARLTVVSPEPGARLLADPEAPPGLATVALEAVVDPPVPQVVWYVDGEPFRVVDYPYGARWPLRRGEHTVQVRIPHTDLASRTVRVRVE